ncbi:MAG: DUF4258 domain-containing protein [Desulfobacteraceae bacterium]|nr:DUF4258 domain-containing protein [Nitrospinota bacterium]MCG2830637.1 DUF4258 domain-containing protein [Desulfobacteraceae bacterium]
MTIEIIDRQLRTKGVLYSIKASDKILKILYLSHAIERIKKWGITEEMAAEALILPEEVISGHRNRYIAHRRYGDHLVRAVYEYEGKMPVLVTVYFPYSERYFKGGGIYEDKILG